MNIHFILMRFKNFSFKSELKFILFFVQVAAVAVLCVQPEPSYRPLITDVLHSFIPLVPVELGGSLRLVNQVPPVDT